VCVCVRVFEDGRRETFKFRALFEMNIYASRRRGLRDPETVCCSYCFLNGGSVFRPGSGAVLLMAVFLRGDSRPPPPLYPRFKEDHVCVSVCLSTKYDIYLISRERIHVSTLYYYNIRHAILYYTIMETNHLGE